MNTPSTFGTARALVLGAAALLFAGCSASASAGAKTPGDLARRNTAVMHEDCDLDDGDAEKLDANADGRPDVTIVKDGGREVCRAVDLNFDGKIDSWVYRDGSGQVRRRELDYDRDGIVEEIQIFRGGSIAEKHRATALATKLDTWHFYQGGKLARTERDSDGDSVVDQWWEYPKPGCPLIHSDLNGDGKPDPAATVDYCKQTGYVPPDRSGERGTTSPSFQTPGALPTELENKPQDGAPNGANGTPAGGGSPGGTPAGGGSTGGGGTAPGGSAPAGGSTAPGGSSGGSTTGTGAGSSGGNTAAPKTGGGK